MARKKKCRSNFMFVIAIVFRTTKQPLRLKKFWLLNKIIYSFCFHVTLKFDCYG